MAISRYSDTTNLKIVYYLGAGASYNAVPIQEKLGNGMIEASNQIKTIIGNTDVINQDKYQRLKHEANKLNEVAEDLYYFGLKATEFGSLDIYARRLYLLGLIDELDRLKFTASTFFTFWENLLFKGQPMDRDKRQYYSNIDKRYLSLLSVLLEPTQGGNPKLNENVTFISWNYDLQLEKAYQTFMRDKESDFINVNKSFNFLNTDYPGVKRDIIHLNGFSGVFKDESKHFSVLSDSRIDKKEDFLLDILDNVNDFRDHKSMYRNYINYAWENNKNRDAAKKIMSEADVLVIIGYSFPAFNRRIDTDLIDSFRGGKGLTEVIYQDPAASDDIMNSFFGSNNNSVTINRDIPKQFYIPHEFLNPKSAEKMVF
ncbi:hypothetical protein [Aestuariibaculum sediminum]|uniref:SIR2-like domain-containing protein n=1 Tax=Aestuariibaculum sediminum TaxID=2770637 RepID=A0A8J6U9H9_9FLAO|nr:hypothetical protein [Aestuariibaculum sediminum]MBD0833207.1 hypothetical protein [Aestuariibaculum sediminum]